MISGTQVLPSRPFTADELREFLLAHADCQRIYLFSEPSLEEVCTEFGFARLVTCKIAALDLTQSEETLWADLDAKRRNGIRYARKHDVVVRSATPADREAAVKVMVDGYCAKFNQPTHNVGAWVDNWIAADSLLLARLGPDGPVIAGAAHRDAHRAAEPVRYFQPGVYSIYSVNTSLIEHQKHKPNDLLVWELALHVKSKGFCSFVLGNATTLFKREFSPRRITVDEWVRARLP